MHLYRKHIGSVTHKNSPSIKWKKSVETCAFNPFYIIFFRLSCFLSHKSAQTIKSLLKP